MRYTPNHPKCNEDLIRDLLNYNPCGALAQAMIVQAIRTFAEAVEATDPATMDPKGMVTPEAWIKCGAHIAKTMRAFYETEKPVPVKPAPEPDAERLHTLVVRLVEWADMMGGWESPIWDEAKHEAASQGEQP